MKYAKATREEVAKQMPFMDWEQVRQNGGPPCFMVGVESTPKQFCGRAERWHDEYADHKYESLQHFLAGLLLVD
jgi:hypothetical protein